MTSRRDFLQKLTLSAFALPFSMQWDFTKSKDEIDATLEAVREMARGS